MSSIHGANRFVRVHQPGERLHHDQPAIAIDRLDGRVRHALGRRADDPRRQLVLRRRFLSSGAFVNRFVVTNPGHSAVTPKPLPAEFVAQRLR